MRVNGALQPINLISEVLYMLSGLTWLIIFKRCEIPVFLIFDMVVNN